MNVFGEKVLVANWFEDRALKEDKIQEYLDRREKGQLLSQKNEKLENTLLNPTKLSSESAKEGGWAKFGDCVMITNPETHLALTYAGDTATAIECRDPQVRNTFVLFPTDGSQMGERLKYGQSFAIATHPAMGMDRPQFLESDAVGLANPKKSRTQPMRFTEVSNYGATWKVLCFDPLLRMETEGMPVPVNSKVLICHCKTNQNLTYLPLMTISTELGIGQEVTARTELDSHMAEQPTNHWILTV